MFVGFALFTKWKHICVRYMKFNKSSDNYDSYFFASSF